MKKTTCTLLLLLFVAVTSFSQNLDSSLKLKGKLDIIPTKYSLSEKSIGVRGVPIAVDSRFPEGFPKYKHTGKKDYDVADFMQRIEVWKDENKEEASKLLIKGIIK